MVSVGVWVCGCVTGCVWMCTCVGGCVGVCGCVSQGVGGYGCGCGCGCVGVWVCDVTSAHTRCVTTCLWPTAFDKDRIKKLCNFVMHKVQLAVFGKTNARGGDRLDTGLMLQPALEAAVNTVLESNASPQLPNELEDASRHFLLCVRAHADTISSEVSTQLTVTVKSRRYGRACDLVHDLTRPSLTAVLEEVRGRACACTLVVCVVPAGTHTLHTRTMAVLGYGHGVRHRPASVGHEPWDTLGSDDDGQRHHARPVGGRRHTVAARRSHPRHCRTGCTCSLS